MFIALVGVTPASAKIAANLLHASLAVRHRSCAITSASSVDDIRDFCSKCASGVIHFEEPPPSATIQFLVEQNIPAVVFVSTFSRASLNLMLEGGLEPLAAVRAASRWFSAIGELIASGRVFVVPGGTDKRAVAEVLTSVASLLGLTMPSGVVTSPQAQVQAGFGENQSDAAHVEIPSISKSDEGRVALLTRLSAGLHGYDQLLERRTKCCLRWPSSTFHLTDKEATPAIDYIDLMGPAKLLVFGPYFGLPRGRWIAVPGVSVADNLSGNKITIDISTNLGTEILAKVQAKLPAEGDYWGEIQFEVPYSHLPIEVRLFLDQGAIEGKLRFNGVTLRQQ